jgi:hypothetical protein
VRDHARVDSERRQRLSAALAVDHDSVEPPQQGAPQLLLARRAPRQEVVRGEHRRGVGMQESNVQFGDEPLHVQHVAAMHAKCRQPERMLGDLERQSQPRALEEP